MRVIDSEIQGVREAQIFVHAFAPALRKPHSHHHSPAPAHSRTPAHSCIFSHLSLPFRTKIHLNFFSLGIFISGKEIYENELKAAEIPPYLRFDIVKLNYMNLALASYEGTIGERFEWVQMILQPFKKALTGSKFKFLGIISNGDDGRYFKDSSTLLDHIDKTLQISDRCRAYKFYIESESNENTSTNVLSALLEFDAIIRCSKITVKFNFWKFTQTHLPIEAVGNWLNRTNADGQEDNERFLKLKIHDDVPNLGEMFEYLKKVSHFYTTFYLTCIVRRKFGTIMH